MTTNAGCQQPRRRRWKQPTLSKCKAFFFAESPIALEYKARVNKFGNQLREAAAYGKIEVVCMKPVSGVNLVSSILECQPTIWILPMATLIHYKAGVDHRHGVLHSEFDFENFAIASGRWNALASYNCIGWYSGNRETSAPFSSASQRVSGVRARHWESFAVNVLPWSSSGRAAATRTFQCY